jgi:hypothetical protein
VARRQQRVKCGHVKLQVPARGVSTICSFTFIEDGRCSLVSRKKNHYKSFESLRSALTGLKVTDAILDGEIVCLDSEGRSQFNQLLYRRAEPAFYAFDLVWLERTGPETASTNRAEETASPVGC